MISHVDRLSSNETKMAPRSVRIAVGASGRSATVCMVASRVGGSNLTLPKCRSLSTSPWDLDGAKRVLDRLAPLAHLLRMLVEPALHRVENMLVLPSGDPALLAGGAAVLDGATLAGVGPVAAQDQSMFFVRVVVGEPFTGRANVNVLLRQAVCRTAL